MLPPHQETEEEVDQIEEELSQQLLQETSGLAEFRPHVEKKRWGILIGYTIFSFVNSWVWILYSPLLSQTKEYYDLKEDEDAILLTEIYFYMILFGIIPVMITGEKFFAFHLIFGSLCNTVCAWMRFFAKTNYTAALIGSALGGFSCNGLYVTLPLMAERWFTPSETQWAIVIGNVANNLGWAFGYVWSPLYMKNYTPQEGFPRMHLIQAIVVTVPTIILAIFTRERPATAPSFAQVDLAWIGAGFLGIGCMGAIIASIFLEFKKDFQYDLMIQILTFVGYCGLITLSIMSAQDEMKLGWTIAANGMTGLGLIACAPFMIESLMETAFPYPDSISVGVYFEAAQVVATLFTRIATMKALKNNGYWVLAAGYLPWTIYIIFFFKTIYRRKRNETKLSNASEGMRRSPAKTPRGDLSIVSNPND